ncbi:trimeric intracellular cation channel family protein [Alloprevotella sp. OH1205_COT-284]|uniref:trimeric intracellular cation channel family protein n=1 Tax=Alloprevotella sp. OH1205_COT-284 TaxID=2491043 RepID=UPI000F5FF3D7|nr:trimeric intracellular cation channel family protein [Alloprevotella sp. OH1205_COT-284]RRD80447.1 trimeric intracellular cation channel family protein [Alloprevotella sp. OH1205_COT-284]
MTFELPELTFVSILDYVGTLAFAISGIRLASAKRFDLFGAYVVGLATAIGGGTVRDLLLDVPVFWMHNGIYFIINLVALLLVGVLGKVVIRQKNTWFIFDTIGLGMFAVIGIEKTLAEGFPFWVAIVMGVLTGSGGGVVRDVFLNDIPLIFRAEIYAVACVLGGLAYWAFWALGFDSVGCGLVCGIVVILSRIIAVRYHINLPTLRGEEHET